MRGIKWAVLACYFLGMAGITTHPLGAFACAMASLVFMGMAIYTDD